MRRALVVKVGGSLLDWVELPGRLSAYLDARAAELPLIVCGGGPAADAIRALDRIHNLGQERAHTLAVRALELTAHALAAIVPGACVVDRFEAIDGEARLAIFAPGRFLDEVDSLCPHPLPHHWDVTSDSIAACIATYLGAAELALLKSAPLPHGTDRHAAARLGLVDPMFPQVSRPLKKVSYVNLRDARDAGRWI
jgi:aspartokinase-like uncharacterized kinase